MSTSVARAVTTGSGGGGRRRDRPAPAPRQQAALLRVEGGDDEDVGGRLAELLRIV